MTTSLQEIREKWIDFWQTCRKIQGNNGQQSLMYLTKSVDEMADFWLSLIKERDAELVAQMEGLKDKAEILNNKDFEPQGSLELALISKAIGKNQAIDKCIDIIKLTTTPTEGGE